MRVVVSEPTKGVYQTMFCLTLNKHGGVNVSHVQVLRIQGGLEKYFIGRLKQEPTFFDTQEEVWNLDKIVSLEVWDCREEAEVALMLNDFTVVDI